MLMELDVMNWPTWTTAGNERWVPNVTRKDKEMPYGELSYLTSGKLEIVPKSTGVPVVVNPGDFVTFPEGFVSDWTVLEELTWHYLPVLKTVGPVAFWLASRCTDAQWHGGGWLQRGAP